MILEHALLTIDPARATAFERAFVRAQALVARASGFHELALWRTIEQPGQYRLLIRWDGVDDHMVGFRESPLFVEWRRLLGEFYTVPVTVDHGILVSDVAGDERLPSGSVTNDHAKGRGDEI